MHRIGAGRLLRQALTSRALPGQIAGKGNNKNYLGSTTRALSRFNKGGSSSHGQWRERLTENGIQFAALAGSLRIAALALPVHHAAFLSSFLHTSLLVSSAYHFLGTRQRLVFSTRAHHSAKSPRTSHAKHEAPPPKPEPRTPSKPIPRPLSLSRAMNSTKHARRRSRRRRIPAAPARDQEGTLHGPLWPRQGTCRLALHLRVRRSRLRRGLLRHLCLHCLSSDWLTHHGRV